MYLNFFDLKKEPFQITPDPAFLYLSPGHKEALASIIYGVEKKKGFVLIIGAVGVGKTTILRAYLEKTEKESLTKIYIFNSNISYSSLLKQIFRELGVAPKSDEISEMVNQLHQALIEQYRQGRNVLLLIDEAQNMPIDTLENLRMLSNLETATEKLIQIVFSAQPEFEKTLNLDELRQLKQRIAVKAVIQPLTREEGLTYIRHRLSTAADKESVIFTNCALRELVRVSRGIPRVINVLCDNSLISAFGYGKRKVDIWVVREIVRDFGMQSTLFARWRWGVVAVMVLALIATGSLLRMKHTVVASQAKGVTTSKAAKIPVRAPAQSESEPEQTEPEQTEPVSETGQVDRVIVKGDTLAKLIKDVYGYVDTKMIRMVKKANPEIENENVIREGGRIVFPVQKGD